MLQTTSKVCRAAVSCFSVPHTSLPFPFPSPASHPPPLFTTAPLCRPPHAFHPSPPNPTTHPMFLSPAQIFNDALFDRLSIRTVPSWLRVRAANHLARNGRVSAHPGARLQSPPTHSPPTLLFWPVRRQRGRHACCLSQPAAGALPAARCVLPASPAAGERNTKYCRPVCRSGPAMWRPSTLAPTTTRWVWSSLVLLLGTQRACTSTATSSRWGSGARVTCRCVDARVCASDLQQPGVWGWGGEGLRRQAAAG